MESVTRSLNFELPHELPPLDKYAQQILENSRTIIPATPTVPMLNATTANVSSSRDILQRIGATLLNSIQLKKFLKIDNTPVVSSSFGGVREARDMDLIGMPPPTHVIIDSSGLDTMDELQRQLEYDKFMNEVWIGIVLTLILISMVFCVCSCFLYHQFRTWKRNYRSTVAQSHNGHESEITKLQPDIDDPVPEYTLVSGLPSYEAALELLNKTPQSCLIMHPSVFGIFHVDEKTSNNQQKQNVLPQTQLVEVTTPLLPTISTAQRTTNTAITCASNMVMAGKTYAILPSYEEANLLRPTNVYVTAVNEKLSAASAEQAKEQRTTEMMRNSISTTTTTVFTPTTAMTASIPTICHADKSTRKD